MPKNDDRPSAACSERTPPSPRRIRYDASSRRSTRTLRVFGVGVNSQSERRPTTQRSHEVTDKETTTNAATATAATAGCRAALRNGLTKRETKRPDVLSKSQSEESGRRQRRKATTTPTVLWRANYCGRCFFPLLLRLPTSRRCSSGRQRQTALSYRNRLSTGRGPGTMGSRGRNVRSRCRCSLSPAIRISSRG